jgi:selenocysteine lyase/cysteine desulfurase
MHAVTGTMEYLEWLGKTYGAEHLELISGQYSGRTLTFKQAMLAMRSYEYELNKQFLNIFKEIPNVTLYGSKEVEPRVATFSFRVKEKSPRQVAVEFGKAGINIWDGNFYALAVTQRLGLEESGGLVRVGAVHYNTFKEIQSFGKVLQRIAAP